MHLKFCINLKKKCGKLFEWIYIIKKSFGTRIIYFIVHTEHHMLKQDDYYLKLFDVICQKIFKRYKTFQGYKHISKLQKTIL